MFFENIEDREVLVNRWNTEFNHKSASDYYQSFGIGFFEYFQLSEDLGAEPLPILSCGIACQFNTGELVPMEELDYSAFNSPTKILIRQLFIAEAKITLGRTRGKFGGIVGLKDAERTMDWESLLSEGNEEKKAIMERLDERLGRLSTEKQIERAANEAENLNRHLKFRPLGFSVK